VCPWHRIGIDIFTQGATRDMLVDNLKGAVEVHFEELLGKGAEVRILAIGCMQR